MKRIAKPAKPARKTPAAKGAPAAADALGKAIKAEKTSLETYLKFARNTTNLSGKDMFIRLSQDEFNHMNVLEYELDKETEGKPSVRVTIKPSDIEEIVPQLGDPQAKVRAAEGTADDLTALNIALDMERKAVAFYGREAERAAGKALAALYSRLAEMEEAHATLIQAELDNIKDMGFWFGVQEFSVEGNE